MERSDKVFCGFSKYQLVFPLKQFIKNQFKEEILQWDSLDTDFQVRLLFKIWTFSHGEL